MLQSVFTENKMQRQIFKKCCTVHIWKTKCNNSWKCCIVYLREPNCNNRRKMLHRLVTENKMQQQMKNVAQFNYGNQNATTDKKCCTVHIRKTKCNSWKCCFIYLREPNCNNRWKNVARKTKYNNKWKMLHRKSVTETKMQQQMKNFAPFTYRN